MQNRERFPTVDTRSRREGRLARAHTRLKFAAGIAAAVIAVGGSGELSSSNTELAKADDNPALGGAALKKVCVKAGLRMPIVGKRASGKWGIGDVMLQKGSKMSQSVETAQRYPLVPEVCNGEFRRVSYLLPQLQDPKRRKKWHVLESVPYAPAYGRGYWERVWSGNKGYGDPDDANYLDDYDALTSNSYSNPIRSNQLYRCTPGPRKTQVRYILLNEVINASTGRKVAKKSRKFPVRVRGGAC